MLDIFKQQLDQTNNKKSHSNSCSHSSHFYVLWMNKLQYWLAYWCHLSVVTMYYREVQMSPIESNLQKYTNKQTSYLFRCSYALSFYRFQIVLGWSKYFVPDQKFIYILWQLQTFCARQKYDLQSVKLFLVLAQKFFKMY